MSNPVVVCSWGGAAVGEEAVEEALTLARKTASLLGQDLVWLTAGPAPGWARDLGARYGVARIDQAAALGAEASVQPDRYVEALAQYCAAASPAALVFSEAPDSRLVAARCAARLGAGIVMNAVDVQVDDEGRLLAVATAYGGDTRAVYAFSPEFRPYLLGLARGVVDPEPLPQAGPPPDVAEVSLSLSGSGERVRVVEAARAEGPRLEDARRIVAGGRGLGAAEHFQLVERLAAALEGLPAASRAIVDEGWVDSSLQIGLTGRVVKPELYIAAGISGASQHMAGCSAAKVIVGINQDPDAPIFRYARYGVVGDCRQVLSELIQLLESGA